jgi:hypothetical protein
LIGSLNQRAITPMIPPKANRKVKRDCDFALYCERNLIERFFNKSSTIEPLPHATTNLLEIFLPPSSWSRLSSCSTEHRA